jgi:hypothetical protein
MTRPLPLVACLLLAGCDGGDSQPAPSGATVPDAGNEPAARFPSYTEDGSVKRVEDWPSWVFLGSGLNLSYAASVAGRDTFSVVFMEPLAFAHFKATREFPEGTMTALAVYDAGTAAPPLKAGEYTDALLGFEMSVKDSARHPDTAWAYYGFGTDSVAPASPREDCFTCHDANAETDHVFTQFYPALP